MITEPAQRGEAVIHCGWKQVLRRKPVVERQDDQAVASTPLPAGCIDIHAIRGANAEGPTVQVEMATERTRTGRSIDAGADTLGDPHVADPTDVGSWLRDS